MQQEYGKAVVKERTNPQQYAELSRYLRMEYGPSTGPGFLLRELADSAGPPHKGLATRAYNALVKAAKFLRSNGKSRVTS